MRWIALVCTLRTLCACSPRTLLGLACLVATSSCSFLFTSPVDPQRPQDCTPSRQMPVADVAAGVAVMVPASIFLGLAVDHRTCINGNCRDVEGDKDFVAPATVAWLMIATHAVSAAVGFRRASRCRRARARAMPPYPQPYPPQQSYPPPPPYPPQPAPNPY